MIIFPPGFVSTRYPGYFWNIPEQKLYTAKGGTLKPMVKRKAFKNHPEGYRVSVNGLKKTMVMEYLTGLKYPTQIEKFPMINSK